MRNRLFYHEQFNWPFETKGQEMRRIVGTSATHQTHSVPGSGRMNHELPVQGAKGRTLGGCAICARSFWLEDVASFPTCVRGIGFVF